MFVIIKTKLGSGLPRDSYWSRCNKVKICAIMNHIVLINGFLLASSKVFPFFFNICAMETFMAVLPQILSSVILLSRPDILENIFYAPRTLSLSFLFRECMTMTFMGVDIL